MLVYIVYAAQRIKYRSAVASAEDVLSEHVVGNAAEKGH